jgi:hypothetical protein
MESSSNEWNYKTYLELCSLLTSRDQTHNYEEIVEELMTMLRTKAFKSTDEITENGKKLNQTKVSLIKTKLNEIFQNTLIGQNYIGFINLILLQCIIAFSLRYKSPEISTYDAFFEINWTNTQELKDLIMRDNDFIGGDRILIQDKEGKEYTLENIEDPSVIIFLVRWIDNFYSDEFIRGFFLNIHYGEVITTKRLADTYNMTPYEFLEHDIEHSVENECVRSREYDSSKMNHFFDFYNYCSYTLSRSQFQKIRVYIFLQIHEGFCYLDPNEMKGAITIFQYFLNNIDKSGHTGEISGYHVSRLRDKNDLLEMIPSHILKVTSNDISSLSPRLLNSIMEAGPVYVEPLDINDIFEKLKEVKKDDIIMEITDEIRKYKIKEYLLSCIILYKEEYDSWKETQGGGRRTKRKPQKQKNRKTKKRN